MNERIKELHDKAFDGIDILEPNWFLKHNKKFAELIVAEMLKTCEDHPTWTGQMIGKQIKQHFEVEEPKGWVCPKCGIDRIKEACPNGHHATLTGHCPMVGVAL